MSNAIITVHRPELTEEERARRMKEIERAAAKLVVAAWNAKKEA